MRTSHSILAFALFGVLLGGWRVLYPDASRWAAGLICLLGVAAVSIIGSYRIAIQRHRAILAASIEPGSGLTSLLSGRFGASIRSLASTALAVPVTGYFALTASWPEILLAMAAALWAVSTLLIVDRLSVGHLRPAYRISLAAPAAVWISAVPVTLVAVWFIYGVFPSPGFADAETLSEALGVAMADLPRHNAVVFEILSALRVADTTPYWLLSSNAYQALAPLALFLLKSAVSYFSIIKVAVDCQVATNSAWMK